MKFREDLVDLKVEIVRAVLGRRFAGRAIDGSELRQQLAHGAAMQTVYRAASHKLSYRPPLHGGRLWVAVDWVRRVFGFARNVRSERDLIDRKPAPHVNAAAGDAARSPYASQRPIR